MNKYYVAWGEHVRMIGANTPMEACIDILQRTTSSGYMDVLPLHFRVSQRGHNEHDDDIILETKIVLENQMDTIPDPSECCEKCGNEFLSEETRHKAFHTLSSDSDVRVPIEICEGCNAKFQPSG